VVQTIHEKTAEKLKGYQGRIDDMMKFRGTTDLVVLNSTASSMLAGKFPLTQIYSIAKTDLHVARAVLLTPALNYGLDVSPKMKDSFGELVVQASLGGDYEDFRNAKKQSSLVDEVGSWLKDAQSQYVTNLRELDQNRVIAVPEAG